MAYDAVARQGGASTKLAVYTRAENMKEKWSSADSLVRPEGEVDAANTERTKQALMARLGQTTTTQLAKASAASKNVSGGKADYVQYTPDEDAPGYLHCSI